MLRGWLVGLVLVLVLVCTLVATAPARLLPTVLPAGQVSLQGLSGTLWRGEASRALFTSPAGPIQLGYLQWRLRPLSILLFAPTVEFESSWGSQVLHGAVRALPSGDLDLEPLEARVDAALLSQFVPVRLAGAFTLQLQELQLRDGLPSLVEGRAVWEGGGWNSPQGVRPLGDYAMDLHTGEDGQVRGEVVTLSGDVVASGGVSFQGGEYAVDLLLEGPGLSDPQLAQALQLMAVPEKGGFRLQTRGTLEQ